MSRKCIGYTEDDRRFQDLLARTGTQEAEDG